MLATWAQFDAQPGFWIKPSSHTKQRREHRLPLGASARQLLANIRERRGEVKAVRCNSYALAGTRCASTRA